MRVLSLFDYTGYAVEPFTRDGHETIIVDIQHTNEKNPRATRCLSWDILEKEKELIDLRPDLLFGFPPCTDLAASGARHFEQKRAVDPYFQDKAVHLCRSVERIGNVVGCPWMLENPVGVLSSLWGKPAFIIEPWEYGGYLPIDDVHPDYPEYIAPRDAYPKKTCIWTGNGFQQPPKRPVLPEEGYSRQHKYLGGKSLRTKNIRSATPRGFFEAVFVQYG